MKILLMALNRERWLITNLITNLVVDSPDLDNWSVESLVDYSVKPKDGVLFLSTESGQRKAETGRSRRHRFGDIDSKKKWLIPRSSEKS